MGELSQSEIKHRIYQMDPYKFEELVAEVWKKQGYKTKVRQGSRDVGIDVEADKNRPYDRKELIQVKRYSNENKIGSEEIRKYATLYQQEADADLVVLVTSGKFTSPAEKLSDKLNVKTVDGDQLAEMISSLEINIVDFTKKNRSKPNSSVNTQKQNSKNTTQRDFKKPKTSATDQNKRSNFSSDSSESKRTHKENSKIKRKTDELDDIARGILRSGIIFNIMIGAVIGIYLLGYDTTLFAIWSFVHAILLAKHYSNTETERVVNLINIGFMSMIGIVYTFRMFKEIPTAGSVLGILIASFWIYMFQKIGGMSIIY